MLLFFSKCDQWKCSTKTTFYARRISVAATGIWRRAVPLPIYVYIFIEGRKRKIVRFSTLLNICGFLRVQDFNYFY